MDAPVFPEFRPHRLLRGAHAQTLAGIFLPWRRVAYQATQHRVSLPDGDTIVLHDDRPETWQNGERIVLLMHGLAGCHGSPYMIRISRKLCDAGVRAFRMDLRGCGAGDGLARWPYHAGRSDDVRVVAEHLQRLCPGSAIGLVGFSLSGNVLLKLLGEAPVHVPPAVDRALAVNPSIDLHACIAGLSRSVNRVYDRYFVRTLHARVERLSRSMSDFPLPDGYRRPRSLFEFDDRYTARVVGFDGAADYYSKCSAAQFVAAIRTPTVILTARDDPLVPVSTFEQLPNTEAVTVRIVDHGGHMGYIGGNGLDPDRRWLDWRVVEWATGIELPTHSNLMDHTRPL